MRSGKYGIISGGARFLGPAGERHVEHDEGESIKRRTELYTRIDGGCPAVEGSRCLFGESAGH